MAKKSFKSALNNPAMQFITVPEEETVEIIEVSELTAVTPAKKEAVAPKKAAKKESSKVVKQPAKTKEKAEKIASKAPEGYKINPMYVEVKSKRVQLVLQPSLFDKVKALAEKNGDSVNNTVHAILEKATENE